MAWWMTLSLFILILFTLLAISFPVAFAFLLTNLVVVSIVMGPKIGPFQMIMNMFDSLTIFTLAPIPLFILMGELLFHSGMAFSALNALSKLLGRVPGRLSVLANLGGAVFAALSGSPMANTAMLGTILAPEMEKRGYSVTMTVGPIIAAGGIAMIIPPSTLAVLYGTFAQISIAEILIAGIIPGILLVIFYLSYIIGACMIKPEHAPQYEIEETTLTDKLGSFIKEILPLGFIMFLVVGLIFFGVVTPTESAALGVVGALILSILYRSFTVTLMKKALLETIKLSVMTFMIIAGSMVFSQVLAYTGATNVMIQAVLALNLSPMVMLILMMSIVFIMGMFIDQLSIMMITIPLFTPLVSALGFDPIWFAILMLINLEVALLTPPFGMLLFVMKGVASKRVSMANIYRAVIPFVICDIVVIILIMVFPAITLLLPNMMRQ